MIKKITQYHKEELLKWGWDISRFKVQKLSESKAIWSQNSVNSSHFGRAHFRVFKQSKASKFSSKSSTNMWRTSPQKRRTNGTKTREKHVKEVKIVQRVASPLTLQAPLTKLKETLTNQTPPSPARIEGDHYPAIELRGSTTPLEVRSSPVIPRKFCNPWPFSHFKWLPQATKLSWQVFLSMSDTWHLDLTHLNPWKCNKWVTHVTNKKIDMRRPHRDHSSTTLSRLSPTYWQLEAIIPQSTSSGLSKPVTPQPP